MCPVCLLYFTMKSHFFFLYTGKPADLLPNNRSNVDWVPTLLLGHDKMKPVSKSGQDRCQRSRNREDRKSAAQSLLNLSLGRDVEPEHEVSADVTAEVPLDAQLDIGCLETPLTSMLAETCIILLALISHFFLMSLNAIYKHLNIF